MAARITRLRYLIHPKWQITFSFLLVFVGFVSAVICGYLAYRLIYANQLLILKHGIHLSPEYLNAMANQRMEVVRLWGVAFAGLAGVLFIGGIFLSHRMVGPIFAFRKALSRLVVGDFSTPMQLRKNDEFHDLKDAYNKLLEQLQSGLKEDIGLLDKVREDLQQLLKVEESPETREKLKNFLYEVADLANEKRDRLRS